MAIFLSLLTAALFGTGDFFGGLAAKKARLIQVVAGSHFVGLIGVTIAALVLADEFRASDFFIGMAAGAFGGIGVAFLYRRLAVGPMSVVAPLTAITSAAVPALWGVGSGDRLSGLAWGGVALAFVAIGLVSAAGGARGVRVSGAVVAESLASGVGFGFFFILFDATDSAAAPWPVVGARLLTSGLLLGALVVGRREIRPRTEGAVALIVAAGLFDSSSNVLFLYATNHGSLTVVAVLSAMYPVSTVILARIVLDERMSATQLAGFAAALTATALIAVG